MTRDRTVKVSLCQISRQKLDFDFERLCSKSLSNINVYACLVCGKYFQGRGRGSWAYRHAVGDNHRVWLNLSTEKVSYYSSLLRY
jgi:U4/U6.U5 tri-snRNP-associated protein 2